MRRSIKKDNLQFYFKLDGNLDNLGVAGGNLVASIGTPTYGKGIDGLSTNNTSISIILESSIGIPSSVLGRNSKTLAFFFRKQIVGNWAEHRNYIGFGGNNTVYSGLDIFGVSGQPGIRGHHYNAYSQFILIPDNNWHHIAYVYKNMTTYMECATYIDGKLDSPSTAIHPLVSFVSSPLRIGGGCVYTGWNNGNYPADICHVMVWDAELNANEIAIVAKVARGGIL